MKESETVEGSTSGFSDVFFKGYSIIKDDAEVFNVFEPWDVFKMEVRGIFNGTSME